MTTSTLHTFRVRGSSRPHHAFEVVSISTTAGIERLVDTALPDRFTSAGTDARVIFVCSPEELSSVATLLRRIFGSDGIAQRNEWPGLLHPADQMSTRAESEAALQAHTAPQNAVVPLTPRERQIAGLIADGLSNRSIAENLSISIATVERHVANIFTKLDFHNRVQVASWVLRRNQSSGKS